MRLDPESILIQLIVLVVSITFHEFGHAFSADRLGDPGPRREGRVNLWPDRHFDLLGFVMICLTTISGFGLGWGKPVVFNPRNFRNGRSGTLIVAACGPLMNLLLALIFGLTLRMLGPSALVSGSVWVRFMASFLFVNLSLMFFNLIPIHPLDGGKILSGMLPRDTAAQYDRFMYQWGPMILLGLVFFGRSLLSQLLAPAVMNSVSLILGT